MKHDSRKLERLMRKILKRDSVSAEELLSHWKGLGKAGDRTIIRALNKQDGWAEFVSRAKDQPGLLTLLRPLADAAGVGTDGLEALSLAGILPTEGDSARTRGDWIREAIVDGSRKEWSRARLLLSEDNDLLEATLDFVEAASGAASSAFLTTLLEDGILSEAENQAVRKTLYRLRQRGIEPLETAGARVGIRELFAVGENRIARWQPILYFRAHSGFGDAGDLYVLQLEEAKTFEIAEQQRDVVIDKNAMIQLAERYSANMEQRSGLKIPVRPMPPEACRYFLDRSLALLKDTTGERELFNFLRFIGHAEGANPGLPFRNYTGYEPPLEEASSVLELPFFTYWMFTTEETEELLNEMAGFEKGPIVLPPAQVAARKHHSVMEWLKSYFNSKNREAWALAFEKASYFLREQDFSQGQSAWILSQALGNSEIPIETIPAANFLLDRSLRIAAQDQENREKEEKKGSLIVSPQEYMSRQGRN